MKTSYQTVFALMALFISAKSFIVSPTPRGIYHIQSTTTTSRNMFSGGGASAPKEDESDKQQEIQKIASAMGMTVEEYQLGLNARNRMETEVNTLRVVGGDSKKGVTVERDGNSPPKHLVVTVTDAGKALGKESLEKEIVTALKSASEKSKKGREDAQRKMMQFIAEQMKGMAQ